MKLKSSFYLQPTLEVAENLIGKFLVHNIDGPSTTLRTGRTLAAEITETEAYIGFEDKASHASRGKTKRNAPMFKKGGIAYIYLIYGMYYCFNIVTGQKDYPAAVLIRGLDYPKDDGLVSAKLRLDGPGKLCREFKIDKTLNKIDITGDILYIEDRGLKRDIVSGPRIGVDYAGESAKLPWRFRRKT
jgi:DNA-3-methyladenine glycosylase